MLTLNFSPFPTLTTRRLNLRPVRPADAPALFELRSDPAVMQFIPRPVAASVAEVEEFIGRIDQLMAAQELVNWAVALSATDQLVGTIGFYRLQPENLRAEVG